MMRFDWRFRTTVWSLVRANHVRNINHISVGQRLIVPGFGFWDSWLWQGQPQPAFVFDHERHEHHEGDHHENFVVGPPTFQAICNPLISIQSPLVNQTVDPNAVPIVGTANLPPEFDPGSK